MTEGLEALEQLFFQKRLIGAQIKGKTHEIFLSIPMKGDIVGSWVVSFDSLCSMSAAKRVWCAKEWHAFTLRKSEPLPGATGSPNLGPILPVRWAPIPASVKLPREVGKPQFFTPTNTSKQPGLVKSYEEDGVYHLLEDDENAARTIVWQLAKRIQDIYYSQRLLPRVFKQGDLRDVFESGDPGL